MSQYKTKGDNLATWWQIGSFILPAIILIAVYIYYPIFKTIQLSFFDWDGISEITKKFVGVANYRTLLGDSVIWKSLGNNLILVAISLLIELPVAFLFAYILLQNFSKRTSNTFRTLFFIPSILSVVVVSLLWRMIYNYDAGLMNKVLEIAGLSFLKQSWLGNPSLVLYSIMVVVLWIYIGYYIVLYTAGLRTIPDEIYEAALIDGANKRQVLASITLPLMGELIRTTALMSMIGSFRYFDLVYVMTKGGPFRSSELLATYMYDRAFTVRQMGYGSAIAMMILVVCLLAAFFENKLTAKKSIEY